jgi:CheY-like chemotaxis protein
MLSRVLVVDDDPLVCELVKEVLDSVEMDAVTLTDSKEASTRLAQKNSKPFSSTCTCLARAASN